MVLHLSWASICRRCMKKVFKQKEGVDQMWRKPKFSHSRELFARHGGISNQIVLLALRVSSKSNTKSSNEPLRCYW